MKIEDFLVAFAGFIIGLIVLSLWVAWSVIRIEALPKLSKALIVVVREDDERVVYRKQPQNFREAFWVVVALCWVRIHSNFIGEYSYRRSVFLTIVLWTFAAVLVFYLAITFVLGFHTTPE